MTMQANVGGSGHAAALLPWSDEGHKIACFEQRLVCIVRSVVEQDVCQSLLMPILFWKLAED